VIENTFTPFLTKDRKLPPALAPALLHRFNSKDGYEMCPDVLEYLKSLSTPDRIARLRRADRQGHGMSDHRVVVGIISNSDDRVPDVLSSLGITVKPLRHGDDARNFHPTNETPDVDFAIMSYDVGFEKPDRRIFEAATDMLKSMLTAEGHREVELKYWRSIYVGDELEKDGFGAADAGWDSIVVDRDGALNDRASASPDESSVKHISRGDCSVMIARDFNDVREITHG